MQYTGTLRKAAGITAEQMKTCLASQQGEEDAVMLYKRMAKKVRDQADHIIAKGEYKAADKYIKVVKVFPEECKRAFEMGAELAG